MKKLSMILTVLMMSAKAYCIDTTVRDLFHETENQAIDFAIASSFESGYAYDLINGKTLAIFQAPIVYVTPYFAVDFGYITGTERGALMAGGTIYLNRLLADALGGNITMVQTKVPALADNWNRLWFGPWVSRRFSDIESPLMAGVKLGLKW